MFVTSEDRVFVIARLRVLVPFEFDFVMELPNVVEGVGTLEGVRVDVTAPVSDMDKDTSSDGELVELFAAVIVRVSEKLSGEIVWVGVRI